MAQQVTLKARGLFTFPNHLSEVPPGALQEALNVVIDRNSVIQPRRGMAGYGTTFGTPADAAKQLITYKDRILFHYDSKLLYDSDGAGTFLEFDGSYTEAQSGQRMRAIEQNGNMYFTTAEGVKKISAVTASDFTTAADYIQDSGGIKALNLEAVADYSSAGFLDPISKVAYSVIWNIVDNNDNLIQGVPSVRAVVENVSTTDSCITQLNFPIPAEIIASGNTDYFYQIYRTGVFTAGSLNLLDTIDPGEEMNLIIEDFYDGVATSVTVTDITPEDFRRNGTLRYTNPTSGEGIEQANEPPPFAKDIASYKGYTFYANTSTIQRLNISQLAVTDLVTDVSSLSFTDGTTTRTYTYRGDFETYTLDFSGMTFPGGKAAADGNYITITSANDERTYKIWFDDTGSTTEPTLAGSIPIKVDTTGVTDTATDLAQAVETAILLESNDFNVSESSGVLTVACSNNGAVTVAPTETIGASFVVSTDSNGVGEDTATQKIFLPRVPSIGENGPTTSQQIDQAARSLVKVINSDTSGLVDAFYLSGANDVPGLLYFEQRDLVGPAISVTANNSTTGSKFSPEIPTSGTDVSSSNEVSPNRIYYSKYQQPEAVPLVNYIDVGPKDEQIQRIVALRDSLFIFKEDAIYRLTGESDPFQVALFDSSAILQAPDSAVVLNNLVYCFSTQGVITVSDTGVNVISRPIEDQLLSITRDGFSFKDASFGVAYETDRAYLLWTVTNIDDTRATQCFRYNSFTSTWTKWDLQATCGIVNLDNDKLYIGAGDLNQIEQERKSRTRTDFADRDFLSSVITNNVNGANIKLSLIAGVDVGDVLVQTQYLTISQFNRMLSKLDNDISLSGGYVASFQPTVGGDLSLNLADLVDQLNVDDSSIITQVFIPGDVTAGSDLITITSHGFEDNDIVYFSTDDTLPAGLAINTKYYITGATTNTFQVSLSQGGSPIDITDGGIGNHIVSSKYSSSGSNDFETMQTEFNNISERLNMSTGVQLTNYPTSNGVVEQEGIVEVVDKTNTTVTLQESLQVISGPITVYNSIPTRVTWDHEGFQDPSLLKHVREGTIIFEDNNFSLATLSYSTDLSPGFDEVSFGGATSGRGDYGQFVFGEQNWGGVSAAKPLRTLIPPGKQRCRWIAVRFEHSTARESYSVLGLSLTYRVTGERAYR